MYTQSEYFLCEPENVLLGGAQVMLEVRESFRNDGEGLLAL